MMVSCFFAGRQLLLRHDQDAVPSFQADVHPEAVNNLGLRH